MVKDLYTDGSCLNNPGDGGWAWVAVENGDVVRRNSAKVCNTTNNRMEMIAAIEAIKSYSEADLNIYTDSIYLKNGITVWIHSWLKSNWKNNKVKNVDLWQELWSLCQGRNIKWYWVKGHDTNVFNNEADRLAQLAARSGD